MKNFIRKLFIALKISPNLILSTWYIAKAWDLVAHNKYQDADKYIDRAENLLTKKPLNGFVLLNHKIMKSMIKYLADKHHESLKIFENVWLEIANDNNLSNDEKLYLQEYIYSAAKICLGYVQLETKNYNLTFKNITPIDINNINLAKVGKSWKKDFPSRNHHHWYKYGI